MADKYMKTALQFAKENPSIVASLSNLPSMVKDVPVLSGLTGNAPYNTEVLKSVQSAASPSNVQESMESLVAFFDMKIILTLILLIWAAVMISCVFFIKNKETKDNIKYTHSILLGNMGILPMIAGVWVLSIVLVTLLPTIIGVLPKAGTLMSSIGDAIVGLIKK